MGNANLISAWNPKELHLKDFAYLAISLNELMVTTASIVRNNNVSSIKEYSLKESAKIVHGTNMVLKIK